MAAKKPAKKPAYPSETYAARQRRGRPVASYSLPEDIIQRLDAYARTTGRTKSEIVDAALRAYLKARS